MRLSYARRVFGLDISNVIEPEGCSAEDPAASLD